MTRPRAALAAVVVLVGLVAVQLVDALGDGDLVGTPAPLLATVLASYVVGLAARVPVTAVTVIGSAAALTWAHQLDAPGAYPVLDDFVFSLLTVGAPAAAGAVVRSRAAQVRELSRVRARLTVQRRDEVRAARLEERNRLEMRLHRGFSEQVAAIAMRAESAVGATDEAVRAALADVETASRRSLDELREALGSLRESPVPSEVGEPDEAPAPRPRPDVADLVLAAVCGTAVAVESVVSPQAQGPALLNVTLALLVGVALVVRRSWPVAACTGALAALAVMAAWLTPPTEMVTTILVLLVCGYTVSAHARRLRRIAGILVVLAGSVVVSLAAPAGAQDPEGLVPTLFFVAVASVVGTVTAGWSARASRMQAAVVELERGREVDIDLAVAEQRHRLASELHDTVAHAMTVICLQATAGQVRPATADAEHLQTVLTTARSSLEELRNGLDNLGGDHALGVAELTAQSRRAGLRPEVTVTGRLDDVPPPTRRLAARVVREAVTNAGRYAPGSRIDVEVHAGEHLRLVVLDHGATQGAVVGALGAGTGLSGLEGEVRRLGGTMTWGPEGAGFRVAATLPGVAATGATGAVADGLPDGAMA